MPYDLRDTLSYLLIQVSRAHRAKVARGLEAIGLHVGQELLLKQLAQADGARQADLANRMEVEPPTVTKMLSRIESTGLVERRRDPADARVVRVYLTDRGWSMLSAIDKIWAEAEAAVLEGLSLEERLLLRRLLVQVRSNLL